MRRAGYGGGLSVVLAAIFVPLLFVAIKVAPAIALFFLSIAAVGALALGICAVVKALDWWSRRRRRAARLARQGGMGAAAINKVSGGGANGEPTFRSLSAGGTNSTPLHVPSPSGNSHQHFDPRFALIDSKGERRFAQRIKGTFQVGKARLSTPTDLATFVRAVLIDGHEGRFTNADGSKHGTLRYGAREAMEYELDPAIARPMGIASKGHV